MASLSLQHINKTYPNGFEDVTRFQPGKSLTKSSSSSWTIRCGKSTTLRMIAGLEENCVVHKDR